MSRPIISLSLIIIALTNLCTLALAVPRNDDFNDNLQNLMWGRFGVVRDIYQPWFSANGGPGHIDVNEINQRLEVRATSSADDEVAVYGSLDWSVMTTKDFQMKIDFFHNAAGAASKYSLVFIGIIYDFDFLLFPERYNYVELAAGYQGSYSIFYYEQGGQNTPDNNDWKLRYSNNGTLYISYDSTLDRLYLSDTGYGSANAWKTITGLVRGTWGRKMVGVAIGGNSDGVALTSGQAYLDNFVIDSGTLCDGLSNADLNEDCEVDFGDFAQFALQWLDCNMDPQTSCGN